MNLKWMREIILKNVLKTNSVITEQMSGVNYVCLSIINHISFSEFLFHSFFILQKSRLHKISDIFSGNILLPNRCSQMFWRDSLLQPMHNTLLNITSIHLLAKCYCREVENYWSWQFILYKLHLKILLIEFKDCSSLLCLLIIWISICAPWKWSCFNGKPLKSMHCFICLSGVLATDAYCNGGFFCFCFLNMLPKGWTV